ncbi:hypothetical protein [Burkholderia cepacia]|uniref:hypothetical protein n=1 Tax=Burkholderia cepacia TaxID=292 RepID=UPI002FE392D7
MSLDIDLAASVSAKSGDKAPQVLGLAGLFLFDYQVNSQASCEHEHEHDERAVHRSQSF